MPRDCYEASDNPYEPPLAAQPTRAPIGPISEEWAMVLIQWLICIVGVWVILPLFKSISVDQQIRLTLAYMALVTTILVFVWVVGWIVGQCRSRLIGAFLYVVALTLCGVLGPSLLHVCMWLSQVGS